MNQADVLHYDYHLKFTVETVKTVFENIRTNLDQYVNLLIPVANNVHGQIL